MKEIERYFRPEFINRLDEVIVFRPLTKENLIVIVEFETAKVRDRLAEQGVEMVLEQSAKDFLIEKGYNPDFGARPLRRAIGQYIEDTLSEMLLSGEFHDKNKVIITHEAEKEHLTFDAQEDPELRKKNESSDGETSEPEKVESA